MINILLLGTILFSQQRPPTTATVFPDAMRLGFVRPVKSEKRPAPAKKTPGKVQAKDTKSTGSIDSVTNDPVPPLSGQDAIDEENRQIAFFDTFNAAHAAGRLGHLDEAANIIEGYIATPGPKFDPPVLRLLATIYLKQGRVNQAYAVLAPRCYATADNVLVLLASISSARRGVVYPGQRAYVMNYIRQHFPQNMPDVAANFPQGDSPVQIDALSCFAVGFELITDDVLPAYFLEETLRLDPGNPLAAWRLGLYYLGEHHYALASQTFSSGIARADEYYKKYLLRYKEGADYLHRVKGG